jgi:endo-1,4-beta-mannosidase
MHTNRLRLFATTATLLSLVSMPASSNAQASSITFSQGQFVLDGEPFRVQGIHYGPWRPGTGPNKTHSFPALVDVEADLTLIREAGANTVLIYDAPPAVLDIAASHGLKVVYVFALDWYSVGGQTQPAITHEVVERVRAIREKGALLAYLLGNEVGGDVLQRRGVTPIVSGLRAMYDAIKTVDRVHPISHANWPPARHLDLSFLDFLSFNVYPLWPPEVVATGFGRYIETVLKPLAGRKPLLISEFGANTIEAGEEGQARLIRESWDGLIAAGAAGGIVFEFADEWWKNYNNPARPGDWWTRVPAPEDEMRHDDDPEETYGLLTADRKPKPSFRTVSDMYRRQSGRRTAQMFGLATITALVVVAAAGWVWARQRHDRRLRLAASRS